MKSDHRPLNEPLVTFALLAASTAATVGLGLEIAGNRAGVDALLAAAVLALSALMVRGRRALTRLADSERALAEAQRLMGIGSFQTDARSGKTVCSDELYRILGLDPGLRIVAGELWFSVVHEEDREMVEAAVREAVAKREAWQLVYRIVRPGGDVRLVECRGAVEADRAGRPVRILGTVQDVTERELAAGELAFQASHDPLTGLPNRTLFLDRLEHALARSRRSGARLAVVFLDLDDFKVVNDTRGHEAGDQLLLALAPRLSAALRPGDTIARFGGDEFVVLCEDLSSDEDGIRIAQRMADACRRPVTIRGHRHEITVSAGVALGRGRSATASDLLRDADAAMYRAKGLGKGRIEVFDDGMRAQLVDRVGLESDLSRALELGELRLLYQPVISLHDERIAGVEALLRWEHPERGLLEPAEFIDVAESTGLIVPIGRWVIDEACRQAAGWRRRGSDGAPLHVSVNLSPRQVLQSEIAADVASSLRTSGLDPSLLELEIEERVLLEDPEGSGEVLGRLAKLGVRLVIDDFGSGYSSLSHISRLMIDAVKIDRSLIGGIGGGDDAGTVVEAVLSMAGALDVGVTAEGVETAGQLSLLRSHGCEYAQGYLFSPPQDPERLSELLDSPGGDRVAA
jgi:diguanylate cyclase (GGDEF)-like protein/PAS domain S-box-containing protein